MAMQFERIDAENTAFMQLQLEQVKAQVYNEKSRELKGMSLVPIGRTVPAGADTVAYRRFKSIGIAKFISDYASGNIPRIDLIGTKETREIKPFADSIGYSVHELAQAAFTGMNIPAEKMIRARTAIEELLDRVILVGDADFGFEGILNNSQFTQYTVPNDGTGTTKTWSTKTPDQIIRDLSGLVDAIYVGTNGRENPNTILLPMAQFTYISRTRMGTVNDTTILEYAKSVFQQITRWDWLPELGTIGAGGTARMVALTLDPMHIECEVPVMFEALPAQARGLEFEVFCHGRTGGNKVYYPLAFSYGDGI